MSLGTLDCRGTGSLAGPESDVEPFIIKQGLAGRRRVTLLSR